MSEPSSTTAMQEYYIRKEGDEDSRGPFTLEQLSSLVEAGQVDRQTFYYDSVSEKWVEIQSNTELVATLFPVKKKLSIRPKESVPTINLRPAQEEKPITVEDMLAAAEGRTEDTKDKKDLTDVQARAAHWGLRMMSLVLLASAAGMLVANMETFATFELLGILATPVLLFGLADLVLALLLFLELTSIYGLVRIRAAAGVGFFAVYFGTIGQTLPLAAVGVGSFALYLLTLVADLRAVIALGILGLAGMGGFSYLLLS